MTRLFSFLTGAMILLACHPVEKAKLPAPTANAAEVVIQTTPPGARLTIDGISLGPSPQKIRLNPGLHRFKASLSGYFPAEQKTSISAQETREIHLILVASH